MRVAKYIDPAVFSDQTAPKPYIMSPFVACVNTLSAWPAPDRLKDAVIGLREGVAITGETAMEADGAADDVVPLARQDSRLAMNSHKEPYQKARYWSFLGFKDDEGLQARMGSQETKLGAAMTSTDPHFDDQIRNVGLTLMDSDEDESMPPGLRRYYTAMSYVSQGDAGGGGGNGADPGSSHLATVLAPESAPPSTAPTASSTSASSIAAWQRESASWDAGEGLHGPRQGGDGHRHHHGPLHILTHNSVTRKLSGRKQPKNSSSGMPSSSPTASGRGFSFDTVRRSLDMINHGSRKSSLRKQSDRPSEPGTDVGPGSGDIGILGDRMVAEPGELPEVGGRGDGNLDAFRDGSSHAVTSRRDEVGGNDGDDEGGHGDDDDDDDDEIPKAAEYDDSSYEEALRPQAVLDWTASVMPRAYAQPSAANNQLDPVLGRWRFANPKIDPIEDTSFIFGSSRSVKERRKYFSSSVEHREKFRFDPDVIYCMSFFSPHMDFNTFHLSIGPVRINVAKYMDGMPVRYVMRHANNENMTMFVIELSLVDDDYVESLEP